MDQSTRDRSFQIRALGLAVLVVLAIVGGVGTLAFPVSAQEQDDTDVTEIDECTTIDDSGQYVLTEDLENATGSPAEDDGPSGVCIEIRSSDVHLDGNGHVISAGGDPNASVAGVALPQETRQENVTIQNLTSSGWYFGIAYFNASGGMIEDVTASNNSEGITLFYANGVVLLNNTAVDNSFTGIALTGISKSETNATIVGSNNNLIVNNTARGNAYAGIGILNSSGTTVTQNTVTNNAENETPPFPVPLSAGGLVLYNTPDTVVTANTVSENNATGIVLERGDHTEVVENNANENAEDGIHVTASTDATIIQNTANDNGDDGIEVVDSNRVLLQMNTLENNADQAIEISNSTTVIRPDAGGNGNDAGSSLESPTASTTPAFSFNVDNIKKCGQTCRDVTVALVNNQNDTANQVTVYTRIYAGKNNTANDDLVWQDKVDVGTLEAGGSYTTTERVKLSFQDGFKVTNNGGWITILTTVESTETTVTFKRSEQLALR